MPFVEESYIHDIMRKPCEEWEEGEGYWLWHYVGRELWRAGHAKDAGAREDHLEIVRRLDLAQATPQARAVVAAAMMGNPDAESLMDPRDVRLAQDAVPIDPPVVLTREGGGYAVDEDGFLAALGVIV